MADLILARHGATMESALPKENRWSATTVAFPIGHAIVYTQARTGSTANQGENTMRAGLIIVGIIIVALGVAAFLGKFNFSQDQQVLKVGDVSATVQKEKTVPQWVGGIGVIVGLGLIAVGATRKS